MKTWTTSALNGYYRDPSIAFLDVGYREGGRPSIAIKGYYIVPHCDPDCCAAFGGVSKTDLGPFRTARGARDWSRGNLVDHH
jgi:hypothetical protein